MEDSQRSDVRAEYDPVAEGDRVSMAQTFGGHSVVREIAETILLALIIFLILNTATGRFQVRGSSMEPNLHDGQYLVISKLTYWFQSPTRGDVVVFHPPTHMEEDYIKRIIGLPGETVEIRIGQVWIDGLPLVEPYITDLGSYSGSWTLATDEYFVLGDNRRNSDDSHRWGVLPRDNIVGKSWLCYWPPEQWGLTSHHTFADLVGQNE
ncbi:MAG: signal peptidase I [Chloroflexi bacterium]|nr:signal peptidase I [Chloroflexota bacterium]